MSAASDGRAAVRAAVAAAKAAARALEAVHKARSAERVEAIANANAAAHRAVRLILVPEAQVALSAVAGPFLATDGEDA